MRLFKTFKAFKALEFLLDQKKAPFIKKGA
jgi:hypothetical protein